MRIFGGLLAVVLIVAALPHCAMACAMACCETMPPEGTLPTTAAHCSGPCEDRNQTISTAPQNITSDATFTPPLISTFVATAAKIEPPAGHWSPRDGQRSAAPTSLAIYLRDRSLLV